jgi:hypothetical protein
MAAVKKIAKRTTNPSTNGAAKTTKRTTKTTKVPTPPLDTLGQQCAELQRLQRQRVVVEKSEKMQQNRLRSVVASTMGYTNELTKEERQARFVEAQKLIDRISGSDEKHPLKEVIEATQHGICAMTKLGDEVEHQMRLISRQLPVFAWLKKEAQKGVGELGLAKIIGEAGDLRGYSGPAKLWRRLSCAPYESENYGTKMGSTWLIGKEGKLTSEEWSEYHYNPRRRSVVYTIGDTMIKLNHSIYREHYNSMKKLFLEKHPDATPIRCHRHASLVMTKLMLKNLWVVWNFGLDTRAGKR